MILASLADSYLSLVPSSSSSSSAPQLARLPGSSFSRLLRARSSGGVWSCRWSFARRWWLERGWFDRGRSFRVLQSRPSRTGSRLRIA